MWIVLCQSRFVTYADFWRFYRFLSIFRYLNVFCQNVVDFRLSIIVSSFLNFCQFLRAPCLGMSQSEGTKSTVSHRKWVSLTYLDPLWRLASFTFWLQFDSIRKCKGIQAQALGRLEGRKREKQSWDDILHIQRKQQ